MADDPESPELPVPQVAPELVAELERLARDLATDEPDGDRAARLAWLIDVLILRGHLTERHRKILGKIRANRSLPVVFASDTPAPEPDIDCASRLALCRARCCSFNVALSEDEVRAGEVEWDLHRPYWLAKDRDSGYCVHLAARGGCTKYGARPGVCRRYDCREDRRVWIDFEAKIPAPLPFDVVPLELGDDEPG